MQWGPGSRKVKWKGEGKEERQNEADGGLEREWQEGKERDLDPQGLGYTQIPTYPMFMERIG